MGLQVYNPLQILCEVYLEGEEVNHSVEGLLRHIVKVVSPNPITGDMGGLVWLLSSRYAATARQYLVLADKRIMLDRNELSELICLTA